MATKQARATEIADAARAVLDYLSRDAPGVTTVTAFVNAYDASRKRLALHVGPLAAKATPLEIEKALGRLTTITSDGTRRFIRIKEGK